MLNLDLFVSKHTLYKIMLHKACLYKLICFSRKYVSGE